MTNVLHLVSDDKFIDAHIDRFEDSKFDNTFVYLKRNITYKGKYSNTLSWIRPFSKEFYGLIDSIDKYDLVIVYYLEYNKAVFVNNLQKAKIKIIWQFYGAEIYNNIRYSFFRKLYGQQTTRLMRKSKLYIFIREIYNLRFFFKNGRTRASEIDLAIKRVDYFNGYIREEYEMFNREIKSFPSYLQLPIRPRLRDYQFANKTSSLLLGNSCSPLNNHLEILSLLSKLDYKGEILVPFSYGKDREYQQYIYDFVERSSLNAIFLNGFIPYEHYVELINRSEAAIFNSYRQMALGNIYICLATGVKIYLSEKNPTYHWLKREGFYISSIEVNLESDINDGTLALKEFEMTANKRLFNLLGNKKNNEEYLNEILKVINGNEQACRNKASK